MKVMQQNILGEKGKLFLNWGDIEYLVKELSKRVIINSIPINSVHGLKRGGYIPAVMISHYLNLPYSDTGLILKFSDCNFKELP